MNESLPNPLASYLRAFERRRRVVSLVGTLGRGAALAVAWVLAACLLDRLLR